MQKISKRILILTLITIQIVAFLIPSLTQASDFNPDYIISDLDLIDFDTMSSENIQKFLENKNSSLQNYYTQDVDGKIKLASEIIYNASQLNAINPKALLVLLQKEQSLVENPNPTQYNYDWAMGWHRPDGSNPNDPALQKYKGFANQVDGAAGLLRWYIDNYPTSWLKIIGQSYNIDGYTITPSNLATVCLYNYTPHYHGNYNFWKIWQRWYVKNYPDGSLLQVVGEPGVWLIRNGQRHAFLSRTAFYASYSSGKILSVSSSDIEKYDIGYPIKFPRYSLLRSPQGTVYLITDENILRGFDSQESFRMMGFHPEEIIDVTEEDLALYSQGKPITIKSVYPNGTLLQDRQTGGVYYVKDAIKYPIIDRSILDINFPNRKVISASEGELDKYKYGGLLKINDGELVKSTDSSAVYVIARGRKNPILSGQVFKEMGYKWENISTVPQKVLDLHDNGEIIKTVN
ncbi:MAG: hypothetical protein PHS07_00640 [Patescibacteria group bacterium]|nr:hypothetical protein [Patescibacteria group bacterium]